MLPFNAPSLPVGQSSFATLRLRNEIYVDKTQLIFELCKTGSKIFLARPRRFGKSLLISTFESLFQEGVRHFRGLAIEHLWQDAAYRVLRLDFSLAKDFSDVDEFAAEFAHMLSDAVRRSGLDLPSSSASDPFSRFASLLSEQPPSSLVLLIDEYDAPLTAHLDDANLYFEVQKRLARVYAAVKTYDGCLRFFFMTGITKLSNSGIFSSFNNLKDISLDPRYGTLLGFTEQELLDSFPDYLERAAETMHLSVSELLRQMRLNYNGFCFDKEASTSVYCPWSVLRLLDEPANGLENYWFRSGGRPAVLKKFLADRDLGNPDRFNVPFAIALSDLESPQNDEDISSTSGRN